MCSDKIILKKHFQGSEDPAGAENLQRCEELLPGTVEIFTFTITNTNTSRDLLDVI